MSRVGDIGGKRHIDTGDNSFSDQNAKLESNKASISKTLHDTKLHFGNIDFVADAYKKMQEYIYNRHRIVDTMKGSEKHVERTAIGEFEDAAGHMMSSAKSGDWENAKIHYKNAKAALHNLYPSSPIEKKHTKKTAKSTLMAVAASSQTNVQIATQINTILQEMNETVQGINQQKPTQQYFAEKANELNELVENLSENDGNGLDDEKPFLLDAISQFIQQNERFFPTEEYVPQRNNIENGWAWRCEFDKLMGIKLNIDGENISVEKVYPSDSDDGRLEKEVKDFSDVLKKYNLIEPTISPYILPPSKDTDTQSKQLIIDLLDNGSDGINLFHQVVGDGDKNGTFKALLDNVTEKLKIFASPTSNDIVGLITSQYLTDQIYSRIMQLKDMDYPAPPEMVFPIWNELRSLITYLPGDATFKPISIGKAVHHRS